jgi:hypothetical protein
MSFSRPIVVQGKSFSAAQTIMQQLFTYISAHEIYATSCHCCSIDRIAKRHIALRIVRKPCCRAQCLKAIGEEDAQEIVFDCLREVESMSKHEKHEHLFQKLLHSAEGVSEGGYLDCSYTLGQGVHQKKAYGVCHQCFQNVYQIGKTQLYDIRKQVKAGLTTTDSGHRGGDDCAPVDKKNCAVFVKSLCKIAEGRGYVLDRYEMAALAIPNNAASLLCFAWMDDHFNLVAESEPNSAHMTIEPITFEEIYDEYVFDMGLAHEPNVSLTSFRRIWQGCFPHVQRRPYIECNLKCMTCASLGVARKLHKGTFVFVFVMSLCLIAL